MIKHRRSADKEGVAKVTGWTATKASQTWDWIDKRQIVERFIALAVLYGTIEIVGWAMSFAEVHGEKTGSDAALIIASVSAPYMALQAAAIAFMFKRLG